MNRNVLFGSGLAALVVGATLVFTGGERPAAVPVPAQGQPLPGLTPMMETNVNSVPAPATPTPAPVPSHP